MVRRERSAAQRNAVRLRYDRLRSSGAFPVASGARGETGKNLLSCCAFALPRCPDDPGLEEGTRVASRHTAEPLSTRKLFPRQSRRTPHQLAAKHSDPTFAACCPSSSHPSSEVSATPPILSPNPPSSHLSETSSFNFINYIKGLAEAGGGTTWSQITKSPHPLTGKPPILSPLGKYI